MFDHGLTNEPQMAPPRQVVPPEVFSKERIRRLTADVRALPVGEVHELEREWRALRDAISNNLPVVGR